MPKALTIGQNLAHYNSSPENRIDGEPSALEVTKEGNVKTAAQSNITTKFREAFESFDSTDVAYVPEDSDNRWFKSKASGDIIQVDGNAVAASYLTISKDPLNADTVSFIEITDRFDMPIEASFGHHMSQRTLGQEFSTEIVDDEVIDAMPDVAIASISQSTTTLSATTATPHGLVPGKRIGIYGVNDSRFNYQALVIATTPTPTTFTATAGSGGTIPSVTAGPFTTGYIYQRQSLGLAKDGTSMIFENAAVTNASFYIRGDAGDALPSGTIIGNHSATILSTASVQAVNAQNIRAFQPTDEYRIKMQADRLQWSNVPIDSVASETNVVNRTQVIPSPSKKYKLRIRATNNKGLSVPVAQIISAVKTASTTATITTDRPHGLTTADLVTIYGIRDQSATSFPNLLTATAVASVVDATHFTIVIGSSGTVTSYGGYVSRVNGGNLPSALGAIAQVIQQATLTNGILTLVGSASWTGALIGDYVNIVGCRNNINGATMNLDGAYRVRNIVTTSLELEPIGDTVMPTDFTITDCGGAVIKRTCLRISFIRIFDYNRERVEFLARPTSDLASSVPVSVNNSVAVGTVTTLTGGGIAHDAADSGNPIKIGGKAFTADPTPVASSDRADLYVDTLGKAVNTPLAPRNLAMQGNVTIANTTETTVVAAAGASVFTDISTIIVSNTSTTGVRVDFRDASAGTVRHSIWIPATTTIACNFDDCPLKQTTAANGVWTAQLSATPSGGGADVRITMAGPGRKA